MGHNFPSDRKPKHPSPEEPSVVYARDEEGRLLLRHGFGEMEVYEVRAEVDFGHPRIKCFVRLPISQHMAQDEAALEKSIPAIEDFVLHIARDTFKAHTEKEGGE